MLQIHELEFRKYTLNLVIKCMVIKSIYTFNRQTNTRANNCVVLQCCMVFAFNRQSGTIYIRCR